MSMASTTVCGGVMLLTFLPFLLNQDHLKADEMVVVVMVCVWCVWCVCVCVCVCVCEKERERERERCGREGFQMNRTQGSGVFCSRLLPCSARIEVSLWGGQ